MSISQASVLANVFERTSGETVRVAASIPENRRYRQWREGKAHPTWLFGHIAYSTNTIVLGWTLGGENLAPKGFGRKFAPDFAGGNPITTDPANYLPWDEILDVYKRVNGEVVRLLKAFPDEDLPKPLKGAMPEPLRETFKTAELTIIGLINHDAYHRGQMAMLNKTPD